MPARDPQNSKPESGIEPPSSTEADAPAASWPLATILVVDDEPGMRNFLLKTLEPRASLVMAAASAEEAEELMRRHRFDLVILDITLPGKSGLELLRDLREQGTAHEVVLITAFADLRTPIAFMTSARVRPSRALEAALALAGRADWLQHARAFSGALSPHHHCAESAPFEK